MAIPLKHLMTILPANDLGLPDDGRTGVARYRRGRICVGRGPATRSNASIAIETDPKAGEGAF
jgi:hypothetical protein